MSDTITIKNGKNGFFEVLKKGAKIGTGYCGVKQCHMETEENGEAEEETVTFYHGNMYRLGSHATKDFTVAWQGEMKKNSKSPCPHCGTK
jgi:hypothetical protein